MPSKYNQSIDTLKKGSDNIISDLETNMGSVTHNEIKEEPNHYEELEEQTEILREEHRYYYEDKSVILRICIYVIDNDSWFQNIEQK